MKSIISFIQDRFNEISTWRGIISIVAGIALYHLPEQINDIMLFSLGIMGLLDIITIEDKGVRK